MTYLRAILCLIFSGIVSSQHPEVCTPSGTCYVGAWLEDNLFASFQGIRYAEPPTGPLRLKVPVPHTPSQDTIDVSKESTIICPQAGKKNQKDGYSGEEDCLFLNVYVPSNVMMNNSNSEKIPVMVWIHGGAWTGGSNTYQFQGPKYFMDKGVVMVTVNYRLGPLGFLALGTESSPGNLGLRDQVVALQWVQDNIANFGGDPGSVTIFGESAGAFSVYCHLVSPMANGLFHKAILQSGVVIPPTSDGNHLTPEESLQITQDFSSLMGCSDQDDLLGCLQEQNVDDFVSQGSELETARGRRTWYYVPDFTFSENPYLPASVEQLMASGSFNNEIEVIIGICADEAIAKFIWYVMDWASWDDYRATFDSDGVKWMFGREPTPELVSIAHELAEFYVGSIDNLDSDHGRKIIDMNTDSTVLYATKKTLDYLTKHGVTAYTYILTYIGENWGFSAWGIDPIGVGHADDLQYIWEYTGDYGYDLNEQDALVRETMTKAWTNFAVLGDPTPPDSGLTWTLYDPQAPFSYWNISGPVPNMGFDSYVQARMAKFDDVMKRLK